MPESQTVAEIPNLQYGNDRNLGFLDFGNAEAQCCGRRVFPRMIRFPDEWDFCCGNGPCDGECCNCKGGCVGC
ncbi:hypothetical protein C1645_831204 [Glomus cerebriforme]|uniref:Uncharacterized protein n=1 Tax=Glomus cerebriforme TaxID=658196 RepID=A0A397SHW5_9GLOM|nr:hypothetical protein C1645_831204 [Glomus cerebriforme]